jgi:hypothetical protein
MHLVMIVFAAQLAQLNALLLMVVQTLCSLSLQRSVNCASTEYIPLKLLLSFSPFQLIPLLFLPTYIVV